MQRLSLRILAPESPPPARPVPPARPTHTALSSLDRAGRAGLSQLADSFVADPRQLFTEGQSVRAQVVTVDAAHSRFSVTLRPSLTASTDGSYLASLFR